MTHDWLYATNCKRYVSSFDLSHWLMYFYLIKHRQKIFDVKKNLKKIIDSILKVEYSWKEELDEKVL